jgi:hypothetical protein
MGEILGYFNQKLLGEPLNWLIVGVIATIWLMLFHVVMKGFAGMKSAGDGSPNVPGQTASPQVGGAYAGPQTSPSDVGLSSWTDGTEALFVGDGALIY